jgi:outer membrane receptor protein involved in Fe transport
MNTVFQSSSQIYGGQLGNTSSISLRGLGASQTLILVDGRRSASLSFEGTNEQPDINGIPLAAIDRIEILPSSASAIYGGSAVGGVINIILKKQYQGGDVRYTYDTPMNADAPIRTLNGVYGFSADGGKTQVMISGQYSDGKPLYLRDRQGSVESGIATVLKNEPSYLSTFGPFPGSTPNIQSADGTYNSDFTVFTATPLTLKNGTPLNATSTHIPVGTSPSTSAAALNSALLANAGTFNYTLSPGTGEYGLENQIIPTPTTHAFTASVQQELVPKVKAFVEFSYMDNSTAAQANPVAGASFYVPSTAPTNPFNQGVAVSIADNINAPWRTSSTTRSATVGVISELPFDWKSEADYTWSKNDFSNSGTNYGSTLSNAFATGALNPFVDTLAHPLNLSQYLDYVYYSGQSSLNDFAIRASGPIGSLPWGSPKLTVGLEHRSEANAPANFYALDPYNPPNSTNTFQIRYFGQSESTDSAYAEFEIPIVTAKNAVTGVRSLELQVAARSERYSVTSGTQYEQIFPYSPGSDSATPLLKNSAKYTSTNPTVGLKYSPVEALVLRTSYGTAFLPPTYGQLENNPIVSQYPTTITDPQTNRSYTVNTVQKLNQDLKPQSSKNWDLGAIFEPKGDLFNGLRIDLEYFQIKEFNVIQSPPGGAQFIVNNASTYADRITRDPTTGLITLVDTSLVNLFELESEGWDMSLDYHKMTSIGVFGFHALGTIQEHYKQQVSVTLPMLEYVGFPGEGGPAKFKGNIALTWEKGPLELSWATYIFGSYHQIGAPGDAYYYQQGLPPVTTYTLAQGGDTIPAQVTHDVFARYTFGKVSTGKGLRDVIASNWIIRAGIKNVFNQYPPFDASLSPFFYSPYGNIRLRSCWVAIQKDF